MYYTTYIITYISLLNNANNIIIIINYEYHYICTIVHIS